MPSRIHTEHHLQTNERCIISPSINFLDPSQSDNRNPKDLTIPQSALHQPTPHPFCNMHMETQTQTFSHRIQISQGKTRLHPNSSLIFLQRRPQFARFHAAELNHPPPPPSSPPDWELTPIPSASSQRLLHAFRADMHLPAARAPNQHVECPGLDNLRRARWCDY